jgi:hypothetical protein
MRRGYQTQWVGQFGVAHELVRRGYLVTFTTGNAPGDDLLCLSPSGVAFSVQVKSLSFKGYFLYQESLLESKPTRFVVFVRVPRDFSQPPEYFVLNNIQFKGIAAEQEQILQEQAKKRNIVYKEFALGINYSTVAKHDFRNAWGNLPE